MRYATGAQKDHYDSAKADGLLKAVQIIDRLTNPKQGEE